MEIMRVYHIGRGMSLRRQMSKDNLNPEVRDRGDLGEDSSSKSQFEYTRKHITIGTSQEE